MSEILDQLANATAGIDRLNPTTGAYATVVTGVSAILIPVTTSPPIPRQMQWLGDGYEGRETDTLVIESTVAVQAGDRVTVTPTGGSARQYRALRPDVYHNVVAHQSIPLADYEPGG